jgi:hypothetical protein
MKKLLFASLIVLGTLSLPSCGGETKTEETADTTTVVTEEPAAVDTSMADTTATTAPADTAK